MPGPSAADQRPSRPSASLDRGATAAFTDNPPCILIDLTHMLLQAERRTEIELTASSKRCTFAIISHPDAGDIDCAERVDSAIFTVRLASFEFDEVVR